MAITPRDRRRQRTWLERIPNDSRTKLLKSSTWTENTDDIQRYSIDVRARPEFELAALTETEVPFGWGLTPEGTDSGEKFRLMFLTDD